MKCFTEPQKDNLAEWVRDNLHIEGMDKLYGQITRNGKANYNHDKNEFFFQTQVTRQFAESKYNVTRVENDGPGYDIDIELGGHIWLQVWFGGNLAGHNLDGAPCSNGLEYGHCYRALWYSKYKPHHPKGVCLCNDLDTLLGKLNQLDKPTSDLNIKPVKIVVAMASTRLPMYRLPEWNVHLKDRTLLELRGDFDHDGNLRGCATLHRSNTQNDETVRRVAAALGFRCVESFNAGLPSSLCGLPASTWQNSYLSTASMRIPLMPKVVANPLKFNYIAGFFADLGYEVSTEEIHEYINGQFMQDVSDIVWADVELPEPRGLTVNHVSLTPIDSIVSDKQTALDSLHCGLYSPYGRMIDREETDIFDSTVIDAGGHLELHHVEELLMGIRYRSGKTPDRFLGDPIALSDLVWLVNDAGVNTLRITERNGGYLLESSFKGIPILPDFGKGASHKSGCIYAMNWSDESGVKSGLRLLGSSFNSNAWHKQPSDEYMAYIVGETAVDPRACGKIVNAY